MPQAEVLLFGDAAVLQHLPSRSVLLKTYCPKAPNVPGAAGGWGIQAQCTLQLRTAKTNLIILSYL